MIYPWRRKEGQKRARRVLRVWRGGSWPVQHADWFADDGPIAQGLLKTRKACNQACCGNPRRWFGQRTLAELKADVMMREQIEDALT